MNVKFKSVVFALSLFLNALFILLFSLAAFSQTSSLSFFSPGGYTSFASVAGFPSNENAVFNPVELTLKPREKAYLQYSVVSGGRQGNLIIAPIYDPKIISVAQTGYGIEITALNEGSTLMQTLTNDGVKDVALVTVEE